VNRSPQNIRFRFSLWYLIVFTAIVATWTSVIVARQKRPPLQKQRDVLARMTTRIEIGDSTKVVVKELPQVTSDFRSYDVYVPASKPRELRFFCGDVSMAGLPPEFESIPLSPGNHQIVFGETGNKNEGYQFQLYVDAQLALNTNMGKEWMPLGWRQARGLTPRTTPPSCLTLIGRTYLPRVDYGEDNWFNGNQDQWATWPGYQLWIDEVGRTPRPISKFFGMVDQPTGEAIGFRDGPRISISNWSPSTKLNFNHPAAQSYNSILALEAEFIVDDKVVADQTGAAVTWKLSGSADQIEQPQWEYDSATQSRSAFLHATPPIVGKAGILSPVIELQWTNDRPKDIGLRLPAILGNALITRWRLRSTEGMNHLWRIIDSGDLNIDVRKYNQPADKNSETTKAATARVAIPLSDPSNGAHSVQWRTNHTQPLQILRRTGADSQALKDIDLYKGVPFQFGYEFSASAAPKAWMICKDKIPLLNSPVPGGRVIDQLVIELDATDQSWVWLRLEELKEEPEPQ